MQIECMENKLLFMARFCKTYQVSYKFVWQVFCIWNTSNNLKLVDNKTQGRHILYNNLGSVLSLLHCPVCDLGCSCEQEEEDFMWGTRKNWGFQCTSLHKAPCSLYRSLWPLPLPLCAPEVPLFQFSIGKGTLLPFSPIPLKDKTEIGDF